MSTVQIRGLSAAELASKVWIRGISVASVIPSTSSKVQIRGISGVENSPLTVVINGPSTNVDPQDVVVLTAVVSGGVASGIVWAQTGGPTVTMSPAGAVLTFEAPNLDVLDPYDLTFRVTVDPGSVVETFTLTVDPPTLYLLVVDNWLPVSLYHL